MGLYRVQLSPVAENRKVSGFLLIQGGLNGLMRAAEVGVRGLWGGGFFLGLSPCSGDSIAYILRDHGESSNSLNFQVPFER